MASAPKKALVKCSTDFWTKGKKLRLINLFESHNDLWNVSSKLYSNCNQKEKLQTEIAEKIGTDAPEVAAKLHNLRCQYNGELRKIKKKKIGSGTDELYVPKWENFNTMKFLSNASQSCTSVSN